MKKFSQYLTESKHTYDFVVKLAFKPDEEMLSEIEKALAKYTLVHISSVRSLPIQREDLDFPHIKNPEVYTFEISTEYPVPFENIRHTIASIGLKFEEVVVKTAEPKDSLYFPKGMADRFKGTENQKNDVIDDSGRLLGRDYIPQNNAEISEQNFGTEYNKKLVKNSIGSTQSVIPSEFKVKKDALLGDDEVGTKSAMGSTKVKKPVIKSFAR